MPKSQLLAKARALDLMIQVFTLLLTPSDRDFQEAADILSDMTPDDLRVLRSAHTRLDAMLDALALDRHLRRD